MIKTIILDFDGVVIESVDIKTKAFMEMFKDSPQISALFLEYHLKNNGKSRFDKFEWLYKNILKRPLSEDEKTELGNKFSGLVFEQLIKCPYVEGAMEFLKELHNIYPIYLASVTPQEELRAIIEKRGLNEYFKDVVGTTEKKARLIEQIIKAEKNSPQDVLFVGDTMEDYVASRETGVRFIARLRQERFEGLNIPGFGNMQGIKELIKANIGSEKLEDYLHEKS